MEKWTYARVVLLFESIWAAGDAKSPQDCQKEWLEAIQQTGWTDAEFTDRLSRNQS